MVSSSREIKSSLGAAQQDCPIRRCSPAVLAIWRGEIANWLNALVGPAFVAGFHTSEPKQANSTPRTIPQQLEVKKVPRLGPSHLISRPQGQRPWSLLLPHQPIPPGWWSSKPALKFEISDPEIRPFHFPSRPTRITTPSRTCLSNHRPGAGGIRFETATSSPDSVDLLCWAVSLSLDSQFNTKTNQPQPNQAPDPNTNLLKP